MDNQFVTELRDLWLEHGSDPEEWTTEAKREAALRWYQMDERRAGDGIADALAYMASMSLIRTKLLDGFKWAMEKQRLLDGSASIASCVIGTMETYPQEFIAEELHLLEPDFEAWKRENELRLEADSSNDAEAAG